MTDMPTTRVDPRGNDALAIRETITVEMFRGRPDGYHERPDQVLTPHDLVVNAGRTYLAQRIAGGDTVASAMAHMAVGTVTTAAALADTQVTGEVARKGTAVNSAITNNVFTAIATFGGAAESVTSLALTEAGLFNHASSGEGTMMQRVTFAAATLAASDLLKITLETNVGSNTI